MFRRLIITCKACDCTNVKEVEPIEGYTGTILKSFWCTTCGQAVAVRYRFTDTGTEVVENMDAALVYMPRKPETGITIRPRASKRRNK